MKHTIKVSLAVSKRIKTAKDLSDFYAYMEKDWEYTEKDYELDRVPSYLFPISEQDRIDDLLDSICYTQGCYDFNNVKRMLGGAL